MTSVRRAVRCCGLCLVPAIMPKRSCPFADAAPLQLKVHVGPKELSQGVFAERYSREVFGECGLPWVRRATPHGAAGDPKYVASSRWRLLRAAPGEIRAKPSPAERTSLAQDRRRDWARVDVKADAALSPLKWTF